MAKVNQANQRPATFPQGAGQPGVARTPPQTLPRTAEIGLWLITAPLLLVALVVALRRWFGVESVGDYVLFFLRPEWLLAGYAGALLTFFGAAHWWAMLRLNTRGRIVAAFAPIVYAWICLMIGFAVSGTAALALLFIGFGLQAAYDVMLERRGGWPAFYIAARLRVTAAVMVALLIATVALATAPDF